MEKIKKIFLSVNPVAGKKSQKYFMNYFEAVRLFFMFIKIC
jgi:hypothetical protein